LRVEREHKNKERAVLTLQSTWLAPRWATGWLIVVAIFGGWQAVHQGQIAFVPVFSVVVDAAMIFLFWEFWRRKALKELNSNGTLGLNG
jgi:hypothetical protein